MMELSIGRFGKLSHHTNGWRWCGISYLNHTPGEGPMAVNPDFRDLFAALNDAGARYLLVGGYAVAFHGQPRFTKDLDVWIEASIENVPRVFAALSIFSAPFAGPQGAYIRC